MPLTTLQQRQSALYQSLPLPDTVLDSGDRRHIAWDYGGALVLPPPPPPVFHRLEYRDEIHFVRMNGTRIRIMRRPQPPVRSHYDPRMTPMRARPRPPTRAHYGRRRRR